ALVRPEEVRLLEEDRIDGLERDELGDVDHLRRVTFELLQLVVADPHVLVLRELVAAYERRAVDDLVVHGAEGLLLDPRAALRVQHVERDVGRRGRGVHPDRNRHEPERDRSRADRMRRHGLHDSTLIPMMREGSITPMDSVPATVERQDIGAPEPRRRPLVWIVTALAALVLCAFIGVMISIQLSGSRVEGASEPERALALIVGRTMDIDEAISRTSRWEQRVYRVLSSDPADDLEEGLRWYDELSAVSFDPGVDLHLAILEGEAGRLDRVQRRTEEWKRRQNPLPAFAVLVGAAYLDDEIDEDQAPNISGAIGEALEPGWFRDRIAPRLAVRVGDRELLTMATEAQDARSARLLARTRATLAVEVVLLAIALILIVRVAVRRRVFDRISVVVLPPAWRARDGLPV